VLKLLPPICRDCGKDADEAKLSPYLDFHLCGACIARREREVLAVDRAPRKAPSKKSLSEAAAVETKATKAKKATKVTKPAKTKKPGGRPGRRS